LGLKEAKIVSRQTVSLYEDVITASGAIREIIQGDYRVVTMAATPKHGVIVVYEQVEKKSSGGSRDLIDDIKNGKGLPPLPKKEWA
jgi:hypothetical protein